MSNLSDSLMVARLTWATWAICSQSLICPEGSEQIAHSHSFDLRTIWAEERMSEFSTLLKLKLIDCYLRVGFRIRKKVPISLQPSGRGWSEEMEKVSSNFLELVDEDKKLLTSLEGEVYWFTYKAILQREFNKIFDFLLYSASFWIVKLWFFKRVEFYSILFSCLNQANNIILQDLF